MLNLVHTTQSMLRAKDSITDFPSTAGDVDNETGGSADFFGNGSGDSEDEVMDIEGEVGSSSRSGMPSWAFSKHCNEHYFKTTLIQLINQTNTALQTTINASTKKLLQAHLASLQLQQIQGFQHARDVNIIKGDIDEMKKAISDKMDSKLPEAIMLDIKRQLRKNFILATKIDALDTRMSSMEASLTAIHLHQAQHTDLLQKLVAAQTSSSTQLDDIKKREKGPSEGERLQIQISKVIVPSITISKPPVTNSIDLINAAAANFRAAEKKKLSPLKWEKIDEDILRKFELVKEPVKLVIHHSQVKQISVNEMSMNYLERGQSSCIKSPKAEIILKPRVNYSKSSLKSPLDTVYETPKPDEKKLLSRSIAFYKDPADSALKKRIAKAKQKKVQIAILAKLHAVNSSQQISAHPSEIIESQDPKKQVEKQKKAPRIKKLAKRTKRKLDIVDKELENQFPKESTPTTTQASKPSVVFENMKVVDPYRNIHGEPIVPKDEPIEWENIPIPDFNLPILSKPKRTKSRAVKKVKLSPLKSKSLVKAQSKANKGDYLYLCDIKEFSYLNLYLDDLDEKNFGFNVTARRVVLKKIEELRSVRAKDALPKTLIIPYTGRRVHLRLYWLMEFMDDKGVRRFFRLEDQLSISSNETLLEMQEKLNLSEFDELEFHRQLQNQIEENNRKLGKRFRPSRN
ncbi:hypothetical protein AgCh_039139 [Apium graveolens]